LLTFLNIFEASFLVKYKSIHRNKNVWITQGLKTYCECKKRLCIYSRDSNDAFYMKYYEILSKVIQEAKKQHYNRLIAKSDYKTKTIWTIIKQETGKIHVTDQMPYLLINDEKVDPKKLLMFSIVSYNC